MEFSVVFAPTGYNGPVKDGFREMGAKNGGKRKCLHLLKNWEAYVLGCGMKKRIALANAHDEPALSAVVNAAARALSRVRW